MNALAPRQTARWLGLVYGDLPALDDPAEAYHEASKISPTQIGRQIEGARRLEASIDLQLSSTRAAKRICQTCTVQTECLEYALANDERFGIWGGLSEREPIGLARSRRTS